MSSGQLKMTREVLSFVHDFATQTDTPPGQCKFQKKKIGAFAQKNDPFRDIHSDKSSLPQQRLEAWKCLEFRTKTVLGGKNTKM
jgi:hypothetical protein